MGRGAKPPGVDPGRAQGTLLGFLSRAPLAPADANEERPLRSARVEKAVSYTHLTLPTILLV